MAIVGCDGCSQSAMSEVGAGLVAYYAAETLADLVADYGMVDDTALELLYTAIGEYLRGLIALQPNGAFYLDKLDEEAAGGAPLLLESDARLKQVYNWIANNLLFTIVGAYIGVEGVLVFQRGDGGYCVGDKIHIENYNDLPPYIAYMFFPKIIMEEGRQQWQTRNAANALPPPGFKSRYFPQATRAAIFSDGMPVGRLGEVWGLADPVEQWDFLENRLVDEVRQWHQEGDVCDDLFLAVFDREVIHK